MDRADTALIPRRYRAVLSPDCTRRPPPTLKFIREKVTIGPGMPRALRVQKHAEKLYPVESRARVRKLANAKKLDGKFDDPLQEIVS